MGRPTGVVYVEHNFVWVGQARVWVGHKVFGLIARTASAYQFIIHISSAYSISP